MDFADGVDEAGVSEGQFLLKGKVPVFASGGDHDFFESGVDDIELVSSLDVLLLDEEERVAHAARHRDDVLPPERLDELGVGARLAVLPLPDLALPLALEGSNSMAFKGCF